MTTSRIRSAIGALVCAAGLSLAVAAPAAAQSLFQSVPGAEAATAKAKSTKRERLVRIDANVLTNRIAPAGADNAGDREARSARLNDTIRLNLFSDVTPTFKRTAVRAEPDGGYVWEGDVPGQEIHEALLVVRNGQVSGRVQLDQQIFSITPLGGGTHRIAEVDTAALPPEAPPMVPPHVRSQGNDQQVAESAEAAEALVTIRVLVAYTVSARNEAGGKAAIESEIRTAVQLSNQAYNRGGVQIRLVLAGMMLVNYAESGVDIGNDLNNLTNAPGLQNVRTRRAALKADLASLFRNGNTANACGVAWFPGGGFMPMPNAGTRETGYSIMNRTCVTNLSFHHELGHNMGLQHDRYVVSGSPGNNYYNFGFVNFPKRQRTIMAYNNSCSDRGQFCTRINWFSSPTIRATGNVVIGKAANTPGASDNTRRLKQTKTAVSKYYLP